MNKILPRWVNEEITATSLFRNLHTLVDNYLKTFENNYYYKFSYNTKNDWFLKITSAPPMINPSGFIAEYSYTFYFNKSCFDYSFFNYTIITKHTEHNYCCKGSDDLFREDLSKNCESLAQIINIYNLDATRYPFLSLSDKHGWQEYCVDNIKNFLDSDFTGHVRHVITDIDIVFDI